MPLRASGPAARPPPDAPARPALQRRLRESRNLLAAAAAFLFLSWLLWDLPAAAAAAGMLLLVLVAAWTPRPLPSAPARDPARQAARWPDASMQAAVEAFPHPAFILDAAAVIRSANAAAAALFPAARPGDPLPLTFRAPDFGEALRAAQAGRAAAAEFRPGGEAGRVYAVAFRPVLPAARGPQVLIVIFEDVSDRLAIARMRADFVANASHELRTPLASLTGFIETLLGPARNDPQATEKFLRIMLDQARRMRRLIDDLLSLSRVEMRVHRRPTGTVDLAAVLRHVGDAMAPLAREHGVVIAVDAPADPFDIPGDRDELVQVVQNLVENAIRYGGDGGRVSVGMAEIGGAGGPAVAVHVQDYGPGIDAEHLPRLTERFYRAETGTGREKKGTGLGLAIVKHILTRHGGELRIESRAGEGARFTVELPRALPLSPDDGKYAEE